MDAKRISDFLAIERFGVGKLTDKLINFMLFPSVITRVSLNSGDMTS